MANNDGEWVSDRDTMVIVDVNDSRSLVEADFICWFIPHDVAPLHIVDEIENRWVSNRTRSFCVYAPHIEEDARVKLIEAGAAVFVPSDLKEFGRTPNNADEFVSIIRELVFDPLSEQQRKIYHDYVRERRKAVRDASA